MEQDRARRRLAAILAADVVGYSRMMGLDETGTRARLVAALSEVVRPAIADHRGRLFKTMGDGFLAEFASVVDAVDCAVRIQRAMARREGGAEPMRLRIGVNVGDVIVEDEDMHGDGVNVAARLEALAEPGGICISRAARDQIRDKLAYAIADMGEVEVKNIARPLRAFSVEPGPAEAGASAAPRGVAPVARSRRGLRLGAAALVALLLVAGAALWLAPWQARVEAASTDEMRLPLPDKPSVAILPFEVASASEGDRVLADAIAQDLTRGLARISGLFVIARSSTLDYVGDRAVPARAAEDLGVRHVVRATLRRSGERVRVDAELIDALSGRIVWSERLDRSSDDLFALQDALVHALASRLAADLGRMRDQPRFTDSPDAFLLWVEADRESWLNNPAAYGKARALALEALEIDPGFVRARAVLAFIDTQTGYFRIADDPQAALERSLASATEMVAAEPDDWYPHGVLAQALLNLRRYEDALAEYDRAIALEPSHDRLLTRSTLALIFLGRGEEAEARLRVAIRLNPFHDWLPDQLLGQALYLQGRYPEAIESLLAARERNPRFIGNMWWRAAAYGQTGDAGAASEAVAEILARMPDAAISRSFIQITDPDAMARFEAGLRLAGLPE